MFIEAETLDDLMHDVLTELLKRPADVRTSRGDTSEIVGALLRLKNPRARLSSTETRGKPFSALGELLWYLTKSNDLAFIEYYIGKYREESDDGRTVYGGYGPRLFAMDGVFDQIKNVTSLLTEKPSSRRAVIQIFDAADIASSHKEIPCTCTLQFLLRQDRLDMFTSMRSNDAFFGLPHDVFAFTMIQEILARTLSVEPGIYNHAVGSLHLYDNKRGETQRYLEEGWQSTRHAMPPMPPGDPWPAITEMLQAEAMIRKGESVNLDVSTLDPYWKDLICLLRVHTGFKQKNFDIICDSLQNICCRLYRDYIVEKLPASAGTTVQAATEVDCA